MLITNYYGLLNKMVMFGKNNDNKSDLEYDVEYST